MKSIKTKLIVYFSILILVISGTVGLISYKTASKALLNNIREDLPEIAKGYGNYIKARIDARKSELSLIASREDIKSMDWDIQKDVLKREAYRNKYFSTFAVIDKNGLATYISGNTLNLSDRYYVKKALNGETYFSDLIVSRVTKATVFMVSTPIKGEDGQVLGALIGRIKGENLSLITDDIKIKNTGGAYVINNEGIVVAHKDRELIKNRTNYIKKSKEDSTFAELAQVLKRAIRGERGIGEYTYKGEKYFSGFSPIEGTVWSIVVRAPENEILAQLNTMKRNSLMVNLGGLIISIIAAFIIGSLITKPIIQATEHATVLSTGDFSIEVPDVFLNKNDEIGKLAHAFDKMTKNLRSLVKKISNSSQQVAASSQQLTATSQQSAIASEEISRTIEEIAKSANDQAEDTERGSSNVVDLGKIIEKNKDYMKELNNSANNVNKLKDEGEIIVNELIQNTEQTTTAAEEVFNGIIQTNESSEKISKASTVIASIAEETNLLALNAAIEAARAGEAGKGFAVVAEEIRKLAEQSTESTKDIDKVVKELQSNSMKSVEVIKEVSEILKEQQKSVKATEDMLAGIANALDFMKKNIENLNMASEEMEESKEDIIDIIQSMSAIAQQNAASTEEASASTEEQTASMQEISSASESLAQLAQDLQQAINKFKI